MSIMSIKRMLALTVGMFVLVGGPASAATGTAAKCKEAKAKAAGQQAAALLKAMGRNIARNPDPRLAVSISKAESKLTRAFSRAEARGGCATSDDAGATAAKVGAFVADVITGISPPLTTTTLPPASSTTTTTTSTTTTTTVVPPGCDCCTGGFTKLRYVTTNVSGSPVGGSLQNFRCSNGNIAACVDDADCAFGYCMTFFGSCSGNFNVSCASDADCTGTCGEQTGAGLPMDIERSSLYFGGGIGGPPLPVHIASDVELFLNVQGCAGNTLTLGPTSPAEAGTTIGCTMGPTCGGAGTSCERDSDCPATDTCETNCAYGPPLPVPVTIPGSEAYSTCWTMDVSGDASGSATCSTGAQSISLPLRWRMSLTGDMLSSSSGPVDVPGVQACPICVRQCAGGSNDRAPCMDGSDCDSGTCSATTSCLGGPDDGAACAPGSPLDVHNCCSGGAFDGLQCPPDGAADCTLGGGTCVSGCTSYPTSNDCGLDPLASLTASTGAVPVTYALTTGTIVRDVTDHTHSERTFAGFCRDVVIGGSLCFEGDPRTNCPVTGDGNAVPCTADSECSLPFESCGQRNPGAFDRAAATRITVAGAAAGQCLADGLAHAADLVSVYDVAPGFGIVDLLMDFPGPGAILLAGETQLTP